MRNWTILGLAATAGLTLAACHPARIGHGRNQGDRAETTLARLDCPDSQGDLQRAAAAPDGKSCDYRGANDERVTLRLQSLDGRSPQTVLTGLESRFDALAQPIQKAEAKDHVGKDDDGDDDEDEDDKGDDRRVRLSAGATGHGGEHVHQHEHVSLNLPGLHLEADDRGAHIRALNQDIEASDGQAVVRGDWNGSQNLIIAQDGVARMRFGFVGAHAVDMTYLVSRDVPDAQGDRLGGYVARGPAAGPLVIAEVHGSTPEHGHIGVARDDAFHDVKRLVERNVKR